ncbi:MAG: glycerophosphodiester phosphodiesterase [Acidimicrobiales bacterium]
MAADLPETIPLLADALERNAGQFINIEIKNHPSDPDYDAEFGISIAVAGLVAAFSAAHRVLISSFDMATILRIREADETIPLAWLTFGQADPRQIIARAQAHELAAINPHDLLVDQAFVDRAHEAGLDVYTWTVDDPERIVELDRFGVDGVITNDPAGALSALGRR